MADFNGANGRKLFVYIFSFKCFLFIVPVRTLQKLLVFLPLTLEHNVLALSRNLAEIDAEIWRNVALQKFSNIIFSWFLFKNCFGEIGNFSFKYCGVHICIDPVPTVL